MATFQAPTKQAIREISNGFSSFCTEEKTKSISPPNKSTNGKRKIVRAKRGSQRNQQQGNENNNNMNDINNINNINNNKEKKFEEMNTAQYIEYQKQTEQHRMKRKRKFDVFSSGSNESLQEILQRPKTFRVPYHSFFYVRVDNQNNSQLQQTSNTNNANNIENEMKSNANNANNANNSNNSNNRNKTKNAFEMMTKASKAINDWSNIEAKLGSNNNNNNDNVDDDNDTKMDQDDDDEIFNSVIRDNNGSNIFYPIHEECLITRSVRVSSEWVSAFNQYEMANNIAWKEFNSDGKIHEYQINRNSGIMLLDLNEKINEEFLNENEKEIKQWVIDHGFSGFICNSCFYLFQPHLYWNLLDDNKRSKIKQALISDMFQTSKTKPANNAWKAWKATF